MIDYKSLIGKKNAVRNIPQEEFMAELSSMAEQLAEVDYHYSHSDEVLKNAWKKLKEYKNSDNFTASQTRPGLELCEHFFPNFFQIENSKGESFQTYWNPKDLEKVIKWNRSSHSTPYLSELRRGIYFCHGLTKNTMFRPHLTKMIVDRYKAKAVLDPCCGWGGRMLGTVAAGGFYIGFEPNTETYKHLMELAKYINDSSHVYVPRKTVTPYDAVEIIYGAGGIPVIAHPYDIDIAEKLIKNLMSCGLRGIEAYHRKHSPACVEYFSSMAEELGLIVTGGSDFHAPNTLNGQIVLGKNFVPEWIYDKLVQEKRMMDLA